MTFRSALWLIGWFLVLATLPSACQTAPAGAQSGRAAALGDAQRGRQALQDYGCVACHLIPGVPNATSYVGPPLIAWSERSYIAGALTNSPANLILWIQFPEQVEPGTAMPNVGVTEDDAGHMAAYLYTLRREGAWDWLGGAHDGGSASPVTGR